MTEDQILHLFDVLGREGRAKRNGDWVTFSCPLAPWTHGGGVDASPSFGVKVSTSGPSAYHCFSCGASGSILNLIPSLWFLSGEYPKELAKLIVQYEHFGEEDDAPVVVRVHPRTLQTPSKVVPVPDDVLDRLPMVKSGDGVYEYLVEERRISPATLWEFQVRRYVGTWGKLGAVFPIIDGLGVTVDLHVRMIGEKRMFRLNSAHTGSSVDYKASDLCFGFHLLDRRRKGAVIGEAPLDMMRLHTLGMKNVLATMGSPGTYQMSNLYVESPVLLAYDDDDAGHAHAKTVIRRLMPGVAINFNILKFGMVGRKDANELRSVKELRRVLTARKLYRRKASHS